MEEVNMIGRITSGKFFPMDKENSVEVTATGTVEADNTHTNESS